MNPKNTTLASVLILILAGCASDPIDPLDPNHANNREVRPQCPIGYEPVYSTEIVIKSTEDDKKTGQPRQTFKCEPIK